MPHAKAILKRKGSDVISIASTATVLDAARMMNDRKIGALVVIDEDHLMGIFTERDIMQRVVAEQRDPAGTKVANVMTTVVVCATPETTTDEMARVMREKRVRHLPVVDEHQKIIGMVSIGDINRAENHAHEQTIQYLKQYMSVA